MEVYSGTPKPKKLPSTDLMEDWINEEPGTKLPTVFLDDVPVRRVRTHHVGRRRADDMGRGLTDYFRSSDHRPNVLQWLSALRPEMIPWIRDLRKSGIGAVHAVTIAPREEESFFRRYTKTRRLKAAYRNFDCVIANATSGRDLLYDMGIRARIEVIPNGVDLDRFHPASGPQEISRIREALGIAPDRKTVVAVGTVSPRKGADILLEAWRKLLSKHDDVDLIFVGTRKDLFHNELSEFKQKIEALLADPALAERVRFTGHVPNVDEYLRAADLCVLASDREGLPNSILEAMSSRTAVLTTRFRGLSSEIGRPGQEFALCERDAASISKSLDELLSNAERLHGLAEAGHRFVRENMDLDRSIDAYAAIYREVAGANRA